jgi:hypothetical protein
MICPVRSRRTAIWVKRQNRNCSSLACSNKDLVFSERTCRLRSASQTLASRKFHVFIDTLVCHLYLWTLRSNKREAHAFSASALLPKNTFYASKNQLTDGMAPCRSLFFESSVQGHWNINRGAHRFLFHRTDYFADGISPKFDVIDSSVPAVKGGTPLTSMTYPLRATYTDLLCRRSVQIAESFRPVLLHRLVLEGNRQR